jgi:kynurenine formamidase
MTIKSFDMNRFIVILIFLFMAAGCSQQKDPLAILKNGKWIDLTWAFDEQSVYWPTNIPFKHDTVFEGINDKGYYYSSFKYSAEEHGGTHFDAPMHFAQGGNSIEKVPVEQLTGEGVMIDISSKVAANRDYQITAGDLEEWEKHNGRIPDNAIILFNTGFGKFHPDKGSYTGTTLGGKEGVENLHFPGLHPDAAQWLVSNRNIRAVGLDTPSIDFGQSKDFMTHRILYANNLTAYENVANLSQLPPKGFWIMAFPMKIKGGSGAPLRIIAFLP